jgi:hypothetical protein
MIMYRIIRVTTGRLHFSGRSPYGRTSAPGNVDGGGLLGLPPIIR